MLMVSLCLLFRALLHGLSCVLHHLEEAGAFDELAGTLLGKHPLLCLFSTSKSLGFCWWAGHEASPIRITTCAGKSSPVPPASPQCCPEQEALTPPLLLRALSGPQHPSPARKVPPTPQQLRTSSAKSPRDRTVQREFPAAIAPALHTQQQIVCALKNVWPEARFQQRFIHVLSFTHCG